MTDKASPLVRLCAKKRGAKTPVRWLHGTGSVLPTPPCGNGRCSFSILLGLMGILPLGACLTLTKLVAQLVTQTYPCEKGEHHQYGCLSRWIATADRPSEADKAMGLQPLALHTYDPLGLCNHTLGAWCTLLKYSPALAHGEAH